MPQVKNSIFVRAKITFPKTRWLDRGFALFQFLKDHHRLPRRTGGGLNDAFYFIKTSDKILDPVRVFVSDKALVKSYVKARLGDEYNVGTIAVLESFAEAEHFAYPDDCVLKPTHMSGEVIFRREGSPVDFETVRRWFDSNYYHSTREANYRHLRRRLIVEPYVLGGRAVEDYKIFCLHGQPRAIQVDLDRHTRHTQNFYTADWERLPFAIGCPVGAGKPPPGNLSALLDAAGRLSAEFDLVRIDLYTDGHAILLGEITNCHQGARGKFVPREGEAIMTRLLFGDAGFSPAILEEKSGSPRP
jgi:hypothetical protein